jgi:hypothetical protein
MRRFRLALALFAACGGSTATTTTSTPTGPIPDTTSGPPPELLGKQVWDGPLTDPMALRALDRVRTALADKAPTLQGSDPRMWLGPVQGWIETRVKLTREVRADAEALQSDSDPRMKLLAAIVFGVAADDFVSDLLAIEPPADFATGDLAAETKVVFRETLESQSTQLAAAARVGMKTCIGAAATAPEAMRAWGAYCTERDSKLAALEARVAARAAKPAPSPIAKPPEMFTDCTSTKEVRHVDPDAGPPDMKAKPAVAYIYTGSDVKGDDVQKLEIAVAAKLGLEVGMPVVDDKELAGARKLVAQKKLYAKGPICGQAPPLPAVLQLNKRKHLIVGEIQTTCIWNKDVERCGLYVNYARPGAEDQENLPKPVFAKVTSRDVPAAEWIASADRLAPDEGLAGLFGMLGGDSSPVFFDLANYRDDVPWLRVASTLDRDTRARVAECVDAPASFDASFTISPVGRTQKATLTPVTAPPADSKVTACVKKALEATGWPCPLDGKSAKVNVRVCVAPKPTK